MCAVCFALAHPGQRPRPLLIPEPEMCCVRRATTVSGIYDRVDPGTVPHPTRLRG
jgi:hypothetical protein